jgi:hypothetical protein
MATLQEELRDFQGRRIILWLNHPELKTINGALTSVEPDHLELSFDNNAYLVPYSAIAAIRAADKAP